MTEPDPYAVLGVPHSATRDEIARAYRALAKRHHPDAGATPSAEMGVINDAWHILSDPVRRARWDHRHGTARLPAPNWTAVPATANDQPSPRPAAAPVAPPSRFDSGLAAVGVVAAVVVLVGVVAVGISLASNGGDERVELRTDALRLSHDPDWSVALGDGDDPPEHRVVAHLSTWGADPERLCTTYGETCGIQAANIPRDEASILITSHEGGTPPVPDPVTALPGGLDADRMIGGSPAAFELTEVEGGLSLAWWQLSPPGFPDRWIEVRALLRGPVTQSGVLEEIETMLESVEFEG